VSRKRSELQAGDEVPGTHRKGGVNRKGGVAYSAPLAAESGEELAPPLRVVSVGGVAHLKR